MREGYYINGNCAIIMFDCVNSLKSVNNWLRDVVRICEGIPIVLCLNKADLLSEEERQRLKFKIAGFRGRILNYFELSNKDSLNLEDPLEYLAKALLKNKHVSFFSKVRKQQENVFHQKLQNTSMTADANIKTIE